MFAKTAAIEELSKRTGIPTSTISDWKQKGTVPSSDKIIAICKALNVKVDEVFEQIEKDEMNQRVITKQDNSKKETSLEDTLESALTQIEEKNNSKTVNKDFKIFHRELIAFNI